MNPSLLSPLGGLLVHIVEGFRFWPLYVITNRPPKGDRSEGFYIKTYVFIDLSRCWVDFIKKHIFIYGNWAGMTPEDSRIFLKVILVLETASKVHFGSQNCFFKKMKKCVGAQNGLLRMLSRPKWLLNIFWNIPESSRLNSHI